jgi:hypothetical protein
MTIKLGIQVLLSFIILTSLNYDRDIFFSLGTKSCKISIIGQDENLVKFISLHDNENTSVEAYTETKILLPNSKLYELKQNEERLIKYEINYKIYLFDPNRIFSNIGIKGTLKKYNKNFPSELEKGIKSFADSLLTTMKIDNSKNYIVALHNNTNNDFSILSYKNSKDAIDVYVNNSEDVDNFFIVTSNSDFEYFKSIKKNVVLQSNNAKDDGSLSIYCQKNKLHYINIEAQHGDMEEQIKMIKVTYSLIKSKTK